MRKKLIFGLLATLTAALLIPSLPLAAKERTKETPPAKAGDLKDLEGTWQAVRLEADGVAGPQEVTKKVRWIFQNGKYTGVSPEMKFRGTYAVDAAKKPKAIDLLPEGGKNRMQAIYKLEGDKLILCIGETRPSSFDTKEGSGRRLYVLKRGKGR